MNGFNSRHTCEPDLPIYLQNDDGTESYTVHEGEEKIVFTLVNHSICLYNNETDTDNSFPHVSPDLTNTTPLFVPSKWKSELLQNTKLLILWPDQQLILSEQNNIFI